jgi:glycosyltransferase involved in cell wall biosynthesis
MQEVVTKHPKVGLNIVGSVPEEEYLKTQVQKLGLEHHVMFEGWQESLGAYFQSADALLLTSNFEGYGMVVAEALAAGCPVVMTDVGCAGEIVHNGENGLVVPVGDREALVRAITRVVTHGVKFNIIPPKLPTKKEYLATYRASWEATMNLGHCDFNRSSTT